MYCGLGQNPHRTSQAQDPRYGYRSHVAAVERPFDMDAHGKELAIDNLLAPFEVGKG